MLLQLGDSTGESGFKPKQESPFTSQITGFQFLLNSFIEIRRNWQEVNDYASCSNNLNQLLLRSKNR